MGLVFRKRMNIIIKGWHVGVICIVLIFLFGFTLLEKNDMVELNADTIIELTYLFTLLYLLIKVSILKPIQAIIY